MRIVAYTTCFSYMTTLCILSCNPLPIRNYFRFLGNHYNRIFCSFPIPRRNSSGGAWRESTSRRPAETRRLIPSALQWCTSFFTKCYFNDLLFSTPFLWLVKRTSFSAKVSFDPFFNLFFLNNVLYTSQKECFYNIYYI